LAGVDLVKYIMAFAVVAIHFRPNFDADWEYPFLFEWFIRLAVPYFFITSGFLLERRLASMPDWHDRRNAIIRKTGRLFKLWVVWLAISLPLAIYSYSYALQDGNIADTIKSYAYGLIVNGWAPRAAPLWFIYSMIWVFLIIAVSQRLKHYKFKLIMAFAVLTFMYWAAPLTQNPYLNLLKTYTSHLLSGGIYILSGMILHDCKKTNSYSFAAICIAVSLALGYFKMPYNPVIGGIGLFAIALKLPLRATARTLSLRYQSMWIYYLHEYVLFATFILLSMKDFMSNPWLMMAVVFFFVAFLAYVMNRLQNQPRYKVLNFLVS
ncbi:MAG: acyltransferase, partial [Muribaculaceae bacterium]|nr:acyltransferase [Muribaculaceae bacterium]